MSAKIAKKAMKVGAAVLLAWYLLTGFLKPWEYEGPSMEPTILNGDGVLAQPTRAYQRGDIVVVLSPADRVMIIKRIVGVGGDTVAFSNNYMLLNGEEVGQVEVGPCNMGNGSNESDCKVTRWQLGQRSFLTSSARPLGDMDPVHVPVGSFFLLGDHLDSSNDSRNPNLGVVGLDDLHGKVVYRYYGHDADGFSLDRSFGAVE